MKRYIIGVAAVLLLAGPADAAAKHRPHARHAQAGITGPGVQVKSLEQRRAENIAKSVVIAEHVWKLKLSLEIQYSPVPNDWDLRDVASQVMAWAQEGDPVIHINQDVDDVNGRYFEPLCDTILHEAGHVAGYRTPDGEPHSSDPRSVMYPVRSYSMGRIWNGRGFTTEWAGTDRRCTNRYYNQITGAR